MRVSHISLSDFRNYKTVDVVLKNGLNVFIGQNGQGKTNLVEAIHFFSGLQSHRVFSDQTLIRKGTEHAVMRMRINVNDRDALLELQLNSKTANKAQLNKNKVPTKELPRWFSSIIFAPEDLQLVRGEPSVRRKFLDSAFTTMYPSHRAVLNDYERVLKQRNVLLKSLSKIPGGTSSQSTTLGIWNEQLISLGAQIMHARRLISAHLASPTAFHYQALVDSDHQPTLAISESIYQESVDVSRETSTPKKDQNTWAPLSSGMHPRQDVSRETLEDDFRKSLVRAEKIESIRGTTMVGPHRDEIHFSLNDLPVKGYASHGETWSFVLSLRLAQAQLLKENSPAGDPVIILDDVFAELDANRRTRLLNSVIDFEQVIVTAAVEADIPNNVEWHKHAVVHGEIFRLSEGDQISDRTAGINDAGSD